MALSKQNRVILFGASIVGEILLEILPLLDVQIVAVCDNNSEKQGSCFHSYTVMSLQEAQAVYASRTAVLASERYFDDIKVQLVENGFDTIYSPEEIINSIDFTKHAPKRFKNILWYLVRFDTFLTSLNTGSDDVHIPRLNVVMTSRCTLNCEHCSSLMPYYKKQSDFDQNVILSSLETLINSVDLIYHVELLGGEPLLNIGVYEVLDFLLTTDRVLHVDIVTNGTVLPGRDLLEHLDDQRVSVVVDDYGEYSTKMQPLLQRLSRMGISHRVNKHWSWADLGKFEKRRSTQPTLTKRFTTCNFNSCTELLDGRLYRCPRSSHGTHLGVIPLYEKDRLELANLPKRKRDRQQCIHAFIHNKEYLFACDHCNGNSQNTLKLDVARQLPRKLKKWV